MPRAYQIVDVWGIVFDIPVLRARHVRCDGRFFRFGFIIHGIETGQVVHETEEIRMRLRIDRGVEQRLEQVRQQLLEVLDRTVGMVDVTEGEETVRQGGAESR